MDFSDYIVYVDESGDHSLASVDENYPLFVLTFCVFRKDDYASFVSPRVQEFKFRYFGHDAVILHERDIRKQKPPFSFLQNIAKRERFYRELNALVDESAVTIIAAVIKKRNLLMQYVDPANPYSIALLFCMERIYAFLRSRHQSDRITHIVVEARGDKEDRNLELEFRRIIDGANRWGRMDCFELIFADKKFNSAGLQFADLTARPIGLRVLRPNQPNRAYDIIREKLRKSPEGRVRGWGIKDFP